MRQLEWDDMRVKVDGRQLHHLRFADDIVLMNPTIRQAERVLGDFDCACEKKTHPMLRHRQNTEMLRKSGTEGEPLDLTVPKSRVSEKLPENKFDQTPGNDCGGQLLMKLLQQQLLLTMFSRSEVKLVQKTDHLSVGEKMQSEPSERKEKSAGNRRRSEANARERNRVQHLGDMFDRLKSVLPIEIGVKISKLATLRIASAYIRYLGCILDAENVCRLMESEQSLMLCICEARSCPKKL